MNTPVLPLDLPPADQVGLVVRNLDAAMALYEPLFGPFTVVEGAVEKAQYRGREEDCYLRCAFGHSGTLEVELVEWVSGYSPHRDFIESGREGMQHLRFQVEDIQHWIAKAETLGYNTVWYKRWSEQMIFAYLERPGDPVLIEFMQQTT